MLICGRRREVLSKAHDGRGGLRRGRRPTAQLRLLRHRAEHRNIALDAALELWRLRGQLGHLHGHVSNLDRAELALTGDGSHDGHRGLSLVGDVAKVVGHLRGRTAHIFKRRAGGSR